MNNNPIFIAEIKTKSMFNFESKYSRNTLIDTALEYGSWISVHTDPRFGGSFDDIYQIRQLTKKPILAKGFHSHKDDIQKCFDLGADYVLCVDSKPDYLKFNASKILLEISDLDILNRIKNGTLFWNDMKFVYNGRDLRTGVGKKSIADYKEYREKCKWLCGASLIKEPDDVQRFYPGCGAFIVGSNLVEFCRKYKKEK